MNNKLQVQLDDETPTNNQNIQFRPNPVSSPWSAKAPTAPTGKIVGAFSPGDEGSVFYNREIPENFADGSDDLFMRSLIKTYAVEGREGEDGNGSFYLKRDGAEGAAKEIVGTHFGWTGAKRDNFVNKKMNELWPKYDVLGEGFIDVAKGPTMLRSLLGEVEISNKLQMQTGEDLRIDHQFRPNAVQQPWSAKPEAAPTGTIIGAYKPEDANTSFYEREIPDNFSNGSDDLLMKSLLNKYTLEGRTDDAPNGKFYLTKDGASSVAKEVVGTHYGWTGDKRD